VAPSRNQEIVARTLVFSGVATIVVAVVLAVVVEPYLIAIALVGLLDFAMARMFSSGRWGGAGVQAATEEGSSAEPADPTQDPSYNPYARED
jgi:hypothetical protein